MTNEPQALYCYYYTIILYIDPKNSYTQNMYVLILLFSYPIILYNIIICSYSLLEQCWSIKPTRRPRFSEIVKRIDEMMEETLGYIQVKS